MNRKSFFIAWVVVLILLAGAGSIAAQQGEPPTRPNSPTTLGTAFTYQGELKKGTTPVTGSCNFHFSLWAAASGGTLINTYSLDNVPLTNGRFTVLLDFGENAFPGDARWLQIEVMCAGDTGFTILTPRQALTLAPYAAYALNTGELQNYPITTTAPISGQVLKWNGAIWLPDTDNVGSGGNTYSNGFGLSLIGNVFNVLTNTIQARVTGGCSVGQYVRSLDADGNVTCGADANSGGTITDVVAGFGLNGGASSGNAILNVVTSTVQARVNSVCSSGYAIRSISADGTVTCEPIGSSYWSLTGNNSTNPTTNFIGTTDNVSLTIRVKNNPAFRLIPAYDPDLRVPCPCFAPNIIGGPRANSIADNLVGATIAGGGMDIYYPNAITGVGNYATIGGGASNNASGSASTIPGGVSNMASGDDATIGGGVGNQANGSVATIGGGFDNQANGDYATVGGGIYNQASGYAAIIPGGVGNTASMTYTLAAGNRAKALHQGSFVWADSSNVDFASTGNDQFFVRASGGVYFFASSAGFGGGYCYLAANGTGWTCSSDRNLKENVTAVDSRAVLTALARTPISRWNMKGSTVPHIGPMAQDFYAAFGVGEDDTHINSVDAQGVALAAIQALYQMMQEKDQRIARLENEVAQLKNGSPLPDQSFNPFNLISVIALGGVIAIGLNATGLRKRGARS